MNFIFILFLVTIKLGSVEIAIRFLNSKMAYDQVNYIKRSSGWSIVGLISDYRVEKLTHMY